MLLTSGVGPATLSIIIVDNPYVCAYTEIVAFLYCVIVLFS